MNKKNLTAKIFLFLVLNDVLETFTHFCFKKSALTQSDLQIRRFSDAFLFIQNVLSSGFLWAGLLSVVIIFVSWSTILSKIDLSVASPIASFSYILIALASWLFLHEHVSALRWFGISIILSGVIVVSASAHENKAGP